MEKTVVFKMASHKADFKWPLGSISLTIKIVFE